MNVLRWTVAGMRAGGLGEYYDKREADAELDAKDARIKQLELGYDALRIVCNALQRQLETPLTKAAGEMQDILLRLVDKTYSEESSLDTILSSLVADARTVLVKVKGGGEVSEDSDLVQQLRAGHEGSHSLDSNAGAAITKGEQQEGR